MKPHIILISVMVLMALFLALPIGVLLWSEVIHHMANCR